MKRFLLAILLAYTTTMVSERLEAIEVFTEAKAAFYYPTNHLFRKIYNTGGLYGLEVTCQTYKNLYFWMSGDAFYKAGFSAGLHNRTYIYFIPIGIGLKFLAHYKYNDVYIGGGMVGTYLHTHNKSPYVKSVNAKWWAGPIVKAGTNIYLDCRKRLYLDLFTTYNWTRVPNHSNYGGRVIPHHMNISGVAFGAGIGFRFGNRSC